MLDTVVMREAKVASICLDLRLVALLISGMIMMIQQSAIMVVCISLTCLWTLLLGEAWLQVR